MPRIDSSVKPTQYSFTLYLMIQMYFSNFIMLIYLYIFVPFCFRMVMSSPFLTTPLIRTRGDHWTVLRISNQDVWAPPSWLWTQLCSILKWILLQGLEILGKRHCLVNGVSISLLYWLTDDMWALLSMQEAEAVLPQTPHFITPRRRATVEWPPSDITNTFGTNTNLSHVISLALDLWLLPGAVFVLRAACHFLLCLSEWGMAAAHSAQYKSALLETAEGTPPLCRSSDVYHCLRSPAVSNSCSSLSRQ